MRTIDAVKTGVFGMILRAHRDSILARLASFRSRLKMVGFDPGDLTEAQRRDVGIDPGEVERIAALKRPLIR